MNFSGLMHKMKGSSANRDGDISFFGRGAAFDWVAALTISFIILLVGMSVVLASALSVARWSHTDGTAEVSAPALDEKAIDRMQAGLEERSLAREALIATPSEFVDPPPAR